MRVQQQKQDAMPAITAAQQTRIKPTPSHDIVVHPQPETVLGEESSEGGWTSPMTGVGCLFLTKIALGIRALQ